MRSLLFIRMARAHGKLKHSRERVCITVVESDVGCEVSLVMYLNEASEEKEHLVSAELPHSMWPRACIVHLLLMTCSMYSWLRLEALPLSLIYRFDLCLPQDPYVMNNMLRIRSQTYTQE